MKKNSEFDASSDKLVCFLLTGLLNCFILYLIEDIDLQMSNFYEVTVNMNI